jgi:hypothetical protein
MTVSAIQITGWPNGVGMALHGVDVGLRRGRPLLVAMTDDEAGRLRDEIDAVLRAKAAGETGAPPAAPSVSERARPQRPPATPATPAPTAASSPSSAPAPA